jgi:hypothetical protein
MLRKNPNIIGRLNAIGERLHFRNRAELSTETFDALGCAVPIAVRLMVKVLLGRIAAVLSN